VKVGVNKYTTEAEHEVDLHAYNEESAEEKVRALVELKRSRDARPVAEVLVVSEEAARAGKNVMPWLVKFCRAYATVSEMADVFRLVFGEFREPRIF
jgi:methylmalonyl-CoA mutase N-terminal domain/subunit